MWRQIYKSHFSTLSNLEASKWKKNKVALVIGFLGTKYKGIQFASSSEINTIERELENALYQNGCISKDNHGLIHKIGWSRSSRTDKGVHAARLTISAKLLLPPNYPDGIKELTSMINQKLPDDIRLFSLTRVNQGFCARRTCHWREYEYHLPLNLLMNQSSHGSSTSPQMIIERLNEALKLMEGSKGMHNFHRAKRSGRTKKEWTWNPFDNRRDEKDQVMVQPIVEERETDHHHDLPADEPDNGEDDDGDDVEEDQSEIYSVDDTFPQSTVSIDNNDELALSETPSTVPMERKLIHHYHNWIPEIRSKELQTREKKSFNTLLYLADASLTSVSFLSSLPTPSTNNPDQQMIIFRFRGQSFLLHQIRIMVSAAVLYAMNVIPLFALDFAIHTPYRVHFPLAPACGLLLVSSGYSRNVSKQDYALSSEFCEIGDKILMTSEEYAASCQFQSQKIYQQLFNDWQSDSLNQIQRWFEFWKCHDLPEETLSLWKTLYATQQTHVKEYEEVQRGHCEARIKLKRSLYKDYLQLKMNDAKGSGQLFIPAKLLLPNSVQCDLIVKHRLSPSGKVVLAVVRSLAYAIARGDAPILTTSADVLDYIERTGGIQRWSKEKQLSWIL